MEQKVQDTILKEAKEAKYFSVSIDSTPDKSHLDQVTIVIRYVLPLSPVERFLTFMPMMRYTAEQMVSILLNFLKKRIWISITAYDNFTGNLMIMRQTCPDGTMGLKPF